MLPNLLGHIPPQQARELPGMPDDVLDDRRVLNALAGDGSGIFGPIKGQMHGFTRHLDAFQRRQGCAQHGKLPGSIARLTQCASEWIFNRRDARGRNSLRQGRDGREDNG
jgi:hypothetical protein